MRTLLVGLSLLLLLCSHALAADLRPGPGRDFHNAVPIWEAPLVRTAWAEVLDGLRLEFFDPTTERSYTAHGPFELLEESANRVEVRASTREGEDAPTLTIVQTRDGLWALARFGGAEFATRIE